MAESAMKTLVPICILGILEDYSDADHHLKQETKYKDGELGIAELLWEEYQIKAERKSIGRNLKLLREVLDIDIDSDREGCWLVARDFEPYEIRLLIDSVMSNRYIAESDSKEIVEKLCRLSSNHFKSNLKHVIVMDQGYKESNREVLLNLEIIDEAIEMHYGVEFTWHEHDDIMEPMHRKKTPWCIIYMNQRYYMVVAKGRENKREPVLTFYALDKMKDVSICKTIERTHDISRRPTEAEIESLRKLAHKALPSGINTVAIKFYAPRGLVKDIKAYFGNQEGDIYIKKLEERDIGIRYTSQPLDVEVSLFCNPAQFKRYAMQHMNLIKIVSPGSLVEWTQMQAINAERLQTGRKYTLDLTDEERREINKLSLATRIKLRAPIEFGKFQKKSKGKPEPIEWLPIEADDKSVLLISRYCIDFADAGEGRYENWWSGNRLQKWLNETFQEEAFSKEEIARMVECDDGCKVSLLDFAHMRTVEYASRCNVVELTPFARARAKTLEGSGKIKGNETDLFWGLYRESADEIVALSEKSSVGMRNRLAKYAGIRPVIRIRTDM